MTVTNPEFHYSELPALLLFKKLGYTHLSAAQVDEERESPAEVVLPGRFQAAVQRLNPGLDPIGLAKAARKITAVSGDSLLTINKYVHGLLLGSGASVSQLRGGREYHPPISYIDFLNIANNDFVIAQQVRFQGKSSQSIPDLVVYVNGLPLAVIECKAPSARDAAAAAVLDLLHYQENSPKHFY
mgnify:CR=1 FL=1